LGRGNLGGVNWRTSLFWQKPTPKFDKFLASSGDYNLRLILKSGKSGPRNSNLSAPRICHFLVQKRQLLSPKRKNRVPDDFFPAASLFFPASSLFSPASSLFSPASSYFYKLGSRNSGLGTRGREFLILAKNVAKIDPFLRI